MHQELPPSSQIGIWRVETKGLPGHKQWVDNGDNIAFELEINLRDGEIIFSTHETRKLFQLDIDLLHRPLQITITAEKIQTQIQFHLSIACADRNQRKIGEIMLLSSINPNSSVGLNSFSPIRGTDGWVCDAWTNEELYKLRKETSMKYAADVAAGNLSSRNLNAVLSKLSPNQLIDLNLRALKAMIAENTWFVIESRVSGMVLEALEAQNGATVQLRTRKASENQLWKLTGDGHIVSALGRDTPWSTEFALDVKDPSSSVPCLRLWKRMKETLQQGWVQRALGQSGGPWVILLNKMCAKVLEADGQELSIWVLNNTINQHWRIELVEDYPSDVDTEGHEMNGGDKERADEISARDIAEKKSNLYSSLWHSGGFTSIEVDRIIDGMTTDQLLAMSAYDVRSRLVVGAKMRRFKDVLLSKGYSLAVIEQAVTGLGHAEQVDLEVDVFETIVESISSKQSPLHAHAHAHPPAVPNHSSVAGSYQSNQRPFGARVTQTVSVLVVSRELNAIIGHAELHAGDALQHLLTKVKALMPGRVEADADLQEYSLFRFVSASSRPSASPTSAACDSNMDTGTASTALHPADELGESPMFGFGWSEELTDAVVSTPSGSEWGTTVAHLRENDVVEVRQVVQGAVGGRFRLIALAWADRFNAAHARKIESMSLSYSGYRKIRGDGNCYYRGVVVGLIEQFILEGRRQGFAHLKELFGKLQWPSEEEQSVHEMLLAALQAAEGAVHSSHSLMARCNRIPTLLFVSFRWHKVDEHRRIRSGLAESFHRCTEERDLFLESQLLKAIRLRKLFTSDCTGMDLALVRACKMTVVQGLYMERDIDINGMTLEVAIRALYNVGIEEFCKEYVLKMDVCAEGPHVDLGILPKFLNCTSHIVVLPRESGLEPIRRDTTLQPGVAPIGDVHLLLRPGHYDLLYPRKESDGPPDPWDMYPSQAPAPASGSASSPEGSTASDHAIEINRPSMMQQLATLGFSDVECQVLSQRCLSVEAALEYSSSRPDLFNEAVATFTRSPSQASKDERAVAGNAARSSHAATNASASASFDQLSPYAWLMQAEVQYPRLRSDIAYREKVKRALDMNLDRADIVKAMYRHVDDIVEYCCQLHRDRCQANEQKSSEDHSTIHGADFQAQAQRSEQSAPSTNTTAESTPPSPSPSTTASPLSPLAAQICDFLSVSPAVAVMLTARCSSLEAASNYYYDNPDQFTDVAATIASPAAQSPVRAAAAVLSGSTDATTATNATSQHQHQQQHQPQPKQSNANANTPQLAHGTDPGGAVLAMENPDRDGNGNASQARAPRVMQLSFVRSVPKVVSVLTPSNVPLIAISYFPHRRCFELTYAPHCLDSPAVVRLLDDFNSPDLFLRLIMYECVIEVREGDRDEGHVCFLEGIADYNPAYCDQLMLAYFNAFTSTQRPQGSATASTIITKNSQLPPAVDEGAWPAMKSPRREGDQRASSASTAPKEGGGSQHTPPQHQEESRQAVSEESQMGSLLSDFAEKFLIMSPDDFAMAVSGGCCSVVDLVQYKLTGKTPQSGGQPSVPSTFTEDRKLMRSMDGIRQRGLMTLKEILSAVCVGGRGSSFAMCRWAACKDAVEPHVEMGDEDFFILFDAMISKFAPKSAKPSDVLSAIVVDLCRTGADMDDALFRVLPPPSYNAWTNRSSERERALKMMDRRELLTGLERTGAIELEDLTKSTRLLREKAAKYYRGY